MAFSSEMEIGSRKENASGERQVRAVFIADVAGLKGQKQPHTAAHFLDPCFHLVTDRAASAG
jgi:hypothetical protein